MFEIDHVPIGHRNLSRLASAFEALGFEVASLDAAAVSLRRGNITHRAVGGAIFIPIQGALNCGVEFRDAAGIMRGGGRR